MGPARDDDNHQEEEEGGDAESSKERPSAPFHYLHEMVGLPSRATLLGISLVMLGCCLNNVSLEFIIR